MSSWRGSFYEVNISQKGRLFSDCVLTLRKEAITIPLVGVELFSLVYIIYNSLPYPFLAQLSLILWKCAEARQGARKWLWVRLIKLLVTPFSLLFYRTGGVDAVGLFRWNSYLC